MKFQKRHLNKYLLILIVASCVIFYYLSSQLQSLKTNLQLETLNAYLIQTKIDFNIEKDVLVFVHIQKTGGSDFDRNIVKNLLVKNQNSSSWRRACKSTYNKTIKNVLTTIKQTFLTKKVKFKKYACEKTSQTSKRDPNWYFSRQTFGWICGLHPDFTDLTKCVHKYYNGLQNINFHYFTILRDPVRRYLSEWQHVARGATWKQKKTKKTCLSVYEKCFDKLPTWENVTLNEFMECEYNLANNRQTRLLADYDAKFKLCSNPILTGIKNKSYDDELLNRAKLTLETMSFFALNEYQYLSGILFQKTFNNVFKFESILEQSSQTIADQLINNIDKNALDRIKKLNYLDIKLYEFAQDLFYKRVKYFKVN